MLGPVLRAALRGDPLERAATAEDVATAVHGRVWPLLLASAEAGGVAGEGEAITRLRGRHRDASARALAATAQLARLRELAEQCGVELHVYKGLASAHTLYRRPAERVFADIDLQLVAGRSGREIEPASGSSGECAFLRTLGLGEAQVRALWAEHLAGRAVHEIKVTGVPVAEPCNIDVHFNPYGLITPTGLSQIGDHFQRRSIDGVGELRMPDPAFALVVAIINQVRHGGHRLVPAADVVRLLTGRAGDIDWDQYRHLVEVDGLGAMCAQGLWAIIDDLSLEHDVPVDRPKGRAWWAPSLGETNPGLHRQMTLLPFHRPPRFVPQAAGALLRWYVPVSPQRRRAVAAEGPGPLTRLHRALRPR